MTAENIPSLHFWQDGLRAMTGNVIELLRTAGEPVTHRNILRVVEGLPRDMETFRDRDWQERSYCYRCLAKMNEGDSKDDPRSRAMVDYFVPYFTSRHPAARELLVDSFRAILGTIEGAC